MKLHGLFLFCLLVFFGSVSAKAETLVPVGRVTQAVPISSGTHSATNNLTPVYPSPYQYPYPNPYPYYGGYPRYSSFGMSLSIGGFGGPGFVGRPILGRRCGRRCARRCSRPVSRCCARRRCF